MPTEYYCTCSETIVDDLCVFHGSEAWEPSDRELQRNRRRDRRQRTEMVMDGGNLRRIMNHLQWRKRKR